MIETKDLNGTDRRSFLKKSGIVMLGSTLAYQTGFSSPLFYGAKTLKVGLVGCGGRGTGAAMQALNADPDVVITAMGDVFEDRLEGAYEALNTVDAKRVKVDQKRKFIGFDAYQKVIDSGVDVVLLTTPPAFRPDQLTAAIAAGKHVFCEKPVAVDAPGVRKVLAAARAAAEKNLSLVSGFCFRYDLPSRGVFSRVLNGDVGSIKTVSTFRNGAGNWSNPRQPGWNDLTYKLRNWHYQNWLSGDFIVEQAVHSLDMMSWVMGDQMPVRATATGGRQVRIEEIYGNIYDHFAVEYEYANGAKGFHFCRQQEGTSNRNTVDVLGTEGSAFVNVGMRYEINGKNNWKYEGPKKNMYQIQHNELFEGIRNGKPINDGEWMAKSTLLSIWGRMAAYSGQTISYEDALNSNVVLGPKMEDYNWDLKWDNQPVALPGITKVI